MERFVPGLPEILPGQVVGEKFHAKAQSSCRDGKKATLRLCVNFAPLRETALLFVPVGNPPACQVVGRHFHTHAIANQNPDTILAHLAGNGGQNHVITVV